MGACCSNQTAIEKQISSFLIMLRRMPNMSNYGQSKERQTTFTRAWASANFGGSVMNPVGAPLKKRNRRNPLEESIKATQINPMFHGGYYILEKVQLYKDDSTMFVDIWVLLESIENDE